MVWIVDLPDSSSGKQGVDDFLADGGRVDDLLLLSEEFDALGSAEDWPILAEEARYGLAGQVLEVIGPNTESDPVGILLEFLSRMGNAIGRGAHFRVEGDKHYLKIWHVSIGETSKGRKGTGQGRVNVLMQEIDRDWAYDCIEGGLSSGEGLVYRIRDKVQKEKDGDIVTVDEGVKDKRLLVEEPEFASPLTVMQREGNTLSMSLRNAWDDKTLSNLTKGQPLRATNSHITISGHITRSELLKHLTETKLGGGIANRFLFALVRRSKSLPFGGKQDVFSDDLIQDLKRAVEFGKEYRCIDFAEEVEDAYGYSACELWVDLYEELSEGKKFLLGVVTSRAEAYVRRLATLYAVLDRSEVVRVPHLLAGLAVWSYCEQSCSLVFSESTGDHRADLLLEKIKDAGPEGVTKTDLHAELANNLKARQLDTILKDLEGAGWIYSHHEEPKGKGRPAKRWCYGNA